MNNMKQILLAMQIHVSEKGTFPSRAIFDKQGKPLLSWRVAMLPYLDQKALYDQFHLDEAWDSPHNRPLVAAMPKIYQNPSGQSNRPGMANYLAVCGEGLMFEGTKGRKLTDITDGTSNTIAVVEADDSRAVEWTKPDDWEYDAARPLAGLGHARPGGFIVGFADGSVRFMSSSIDPKTFHGLLTIAGGETVPAGIELWARTSRSRRPEQACAVPAMPRFNRGIAGTALRLARPTLFRQLHRRFILGEWQ